MTSRLLRLLGAMALACAVADPAMAQRYEPLPPVPATAPTAPTPAARPALAMAPEMPAPPLEPSMAYAYALADAGAPLRGPSLQRFPQDPADSLYREARQVLNRGEWRRAATLFARVVDHRPPSAYAADALYWQSFSLYRIGGTTELRQALAALDSRKTRFPNARSETEAATLATRIRGALAARGDRAAEAQLAREASAGVSTCDTDETSVRSAALSALMRSDPEAAQQLVNRILDRRDECSEPLRKNAVTMLGSKGDDAARAKLAQVVRNDPSVDIRSSAIGYLAKSSGDEVVPTLEAVIRSDDNDRLRRAAVRALGAHESPRAKAAIRALVERSDAAESLRLEAISTFDRGAGYSFSTVTPSGRAPAATAVTAVTPESRRAPAPAVAPRPAAAPTVVLSAELAEARAAQAEAISSLSIDGVRVDASTNIVTIDGAEWISSSERRISPEDATWLRNVYPRLETNNLRSRAVAVLARSGDEATLAWLLALVQREEEPASIRATVLSRLGRDLPINSLNRLYDSASNRAVRQQIVSTLGSRKEPEATDKLFQIVRTDTDPQLRRSAMSALTRKNDPRTTQLLMELIDK